MKLINPSFEIIPQQKGIDGINKIIEIAGRTCYKSEDKIYDYTIGDKKFKASDIIPVEFEDVKASLNGGTLATYTKEMSAEELYEYQSNTEQCYGIKKESSATEFVQRMIKSGHGAMLEHGTVYLKMSGGILDLLNKHNYTSYTKNKYSKVKTIVDDNYILYHAITTNYRVLMQGDYATYDEAITNNFDKNWLEDLQYLCEPTEYHEKRIAVNFNAISRVQGESFLRHRVFSFARQSTRYCNFCNDKFGDDLTFIIPYYLSVDAGNYGSLGESLKVGKCITKNCTETLILEDNPILYSFFDSIECAEINYKKLIKNGCKPQEAREVLPLALNSPLVMTGFVSDWKQFFILRCDKTAHPDARALAIPLQEEFKKLNFI